MLLSLLHTMHSELRFERQVGENFGEEVGEDLRQSNKHLHRNSHENELHHILGIGSRPVRLGHREGRDGTRWHWRQAGLEQARPEDHDDVAIWAS